MTAVDDDEITFATGEVKARPLSAKERLRADLRRRQEASRKNVWIGLDGSSWRVEYRVPTDGEELADIQARAAKKGKRDGTEGVWFNRMVLARFCVSMSDSTEPILGDDGTPWTFAHPEALDFYAASSAVDCVSKAYVTDADVAAAASKLLAHGGFGERSDVEVTEDPTSAG